MKSCKKLEIKNFYLKLQFLWSLNVMYQFSLKKQSKLEAVVRVMFSNELRREYWCRIDKK